MNITQILFLLSTFLAAIGLIIIIYSRDNQNITSRLFILFLFLVLGYLISHGIHFTLLKIDDVTILDISCHSFLLVIMVTLTFFTWNFPVPKKIGYIRGLIILLPSIVLLIALWSGNLVEQSHAHSGKFRAIFNDTYPIFLFWYLILIFLSVIWLLKKYKTESNSQIQKQILLFFLGLVITNLATFIFGLLLPWILGFYYLVEISPLAFLIGVILFTTVAVGRYNMFPAALNRVRNFSLNKKIFLSSLVLVPIVILLIQIPVGKLIFKLETNAEITRYFWISLFGGVIVSISISFVILKTISNPLNILKANAFEIQKGNYGIENELHSNDELGDLAEAFNNMSRTLKINSMELKAREERISLLLNAFEKSLAAIAIVNTNYEVIEINSRFGEIIKKSKEEILGYSIRDLQFSNSINDFEKIIETLKENKSFKDELTFFDSYGNKKYLLISVSPASIQGDESKGYLFVEVDITDRKKLEEQLLKAEKLAALGEMAAVLAHEIKTPLTSIKMNTDILLESMGLSEEAERSFSIIQKEVTRLNNLVKDVLQFSRQMDLEYSKVDLADIIGSVKLQIENKLSEKKFKLINNVSRITIVGDGEKLKQVFLNLIDNAIEAAERDGEVKIESTNVNNKNLKLIISDNGRGIEHGEKIFEPFFTTKASGTGLGLAISQKIIEQHGGNIKLVSSQPGKTIFEIVLPINMN
ncbi:MAG: PAS domain S-box protein [Bacteroidetes bacterium]|nr:PAS domain S-box protein [Bacteroidota bacterium]